MDKSNSVAGFLPQLSFYGKHRISVKGRGSHLFYGISFKITIMEMIIPGQRLECMILLEKISWLGWR